MTLEYVPVESARAATGTRLVTSGLVPSPWSEAAKGLFAVAKLPALVVAKTRDNTEAVHAWTGVDNVPVVFHDAEPARTNWSAIVGLAGRLSEPDTLVPASPEARASMMGLIEMIAGEQGLGWTARLSMIQASVESKGERGFALPVAGYLAKRYGHTSAVSSADVRARVAALIATLRAELGDREYFGGARPSALDIYTATFHTPLFAIDASVCPQLSDLGRRGFAAARDLLEDLVPPELRAHRTRMFERHLPQPIRLF